MTIREASHAGSWYSASGSTLAAQLDQWLSEVPNELPGIGGIPVPGARVVICPHAGYAYSGPCAAWAYKCLDLSKAKRIFILHPSHHHPLSTLALPTCTAYETPLSSHSLPLDVETISHLSTLSTTANNRTLRFTTMSPAIDEAEHSAEMQLPYLHRLLQLQHPNQSESAYPPLVPIMVGSTNPTTEVAFGKLLAPYIADESNAFVISSDFCHWGSRFGYTYYLPTAPSPAISPLTLPNGVAVSVSSSPTSSSDNSSNIHKDPTVSTGQSLRSSSSTPLSKSNPKIHESIAHADRACMSAIATGQHADFLDVLRATENTICGRHPIGIFMAGVEEVERQLQQQASAGSSEEDGSARTRQRRFQFVRYERSSDVLSVRDSSVSYVSAFAVL